MTLEYRLLEIEEVRFEIRRLRTKSEETLNLYLEQRKELMDLVEKTEKLEKELKEVSDGV